MGLAVARAAGHRAGARIDTPAMRGLAVRDDRPRDLAECRKDRMDLLRYRLSGNPRLTGEQVLSLCPRSRRSHASGRQGNPHAQGSYEGPAQARAWAEEVLQSPDVDGLAYVQGTNTIERPRIF